MTRLEEIEAEQAEIKKTMKLLQASIESVRWNYQALYSTWEHYKKSWMALEYERAEEAKLVKRVQYEHKPLKTPSLEEMSIEELEEILAQMSSRLEMMKTPCEE